MGFDDRKRPAGDPVPRRAGDGRLPGARWRGARRHSDGAPWDQRGAGRSDPTGPFSIERSVADLEALRTHFGHGRWVLFGHSWGANLAILYGQRHPERVAGIAYVCGTGLEWWPVFTQMHKQNQQARLERRAAVEALPVVHRRALEGCGHFPWLEDGHAFTALIRPYAADMLATLDRESRGW